MNSISASNLICRVGCAASLVVLAPLCLAQTARPPGLKVVPHSAAPSGSIAAAAPAAAPPAAAPLIAPAAARVAPNPAGLDSRFPAGLPSPGDTPPGSPVVDAGVATTNVMGAGLATPRASVSTAGAYTALQAAQSFIGADANRDGELTRTEAQRLTIAPLSFEDMDRNHDGILTRFEYDDAVR